jgi:DNA-binding NarL/FixJ family response regulator
VEPLRVVLVEDNDVFRDALALLFDLHDDVELVASLPDGSEAVGLCARLEPDVILVDYRLPGLDGVEVAQAVRHAYPDIAVVCLSGGEIGEQAVGALRAAGVDEVVVKDAPFEAMLAAINRAGGRA